MVKRGNDIEKERECKGIFMVVEKRVRGGRERQTGRGRVRLAGGRRKGSRGK